MIGGVVTGMPAYKAGLKEGDRVAGGERHSRSQVWDDLPRALRGQVDQPVRLRVERDGQRVRPHRDARSIPRAGAARAARRIGIEARRVTATTSSATRSLEVDPDRRSRATGDLVANVYGGMWLTISRPLYYREYLGGPIFIAQAASERRGAASTATSNSWRMINVAIMAFNLLPIPVLDGGHIRWRCSRRCAVRPSRRAPTCASRRSGLVVIGTLFVLILANDPLRWLQRQRALDKAPQEGQVAPSPP